LQRVCNRLECKSYQRIFREIAMRKIWQPVVAGQFYPDNPYELRALVKGFIRAAREKRGGNLPLPKAIIAPHAGYVYSGPTAGYAYSVLPELRGKITRVILLGPAHHVPFAGIAVPSAYLFALPIGDIALDRKTIESLVNTGRASYVDGAFQSEHSLEVQLPFLKLGLKDFQLVPLLLGQMDAETVTTVLNDLWGGDETLIVVSTDLSHFLPYENAQVTDIACTEAIETLSPEKITNDQACGRLSVKALLLAAKDRGMRVETLDIRNSGDTSGPKDRVVGYGAWHFYEEV